MQVNKQEHADGASAESGQRWVRQRVLLAGAYFLCTFVTAAFLSLVLVVNSQGGSSQTPWSLILVILVTSPLPTLFVGTAVLRRRRWAPALAIALPLVQAAGALAKQVGISNAGTHIGDLDWPTSAVFYLCSMQTFYLPASLFLAVWVALLVALDLVRRTRSGDA